MSHDFDWLSDMGDLIPEDPGEVKIFVCVVIIVAIVFLAIYFCK